MRVITTRFVLGALLLGTLCLMAEPAEAGLLRRRGARGGGDCCCSGGYGGGYTMAYGGGYSGGYAATPCCGGSTMAYGTSGYYQPGYGSYYGGQVYGAGGYYQPGGIAPAGGFPSPMPGAGGPQPGAPNLTNAEKVRIIDGTFEPATLNITTGTTVRWTNEGKNPHTVSSNNGTWGSADIPPGGEFTATFTKAGTFEYHCKLHKDMKGTVNVKDSGK